MGKLTVVCITVMIGVIHATSSNLDLWEAADKGDLDKVYAALDAGANPNWKNPEKYERTPLHVAAQYNHPAVARALLDWGADLNSVTKHGATPIYFASEYGYTDMVSMLIEEGADIDMSDYIMGLTPIMKATFGRHVSTVKALLSANADLTPVDYTFGWTVLHFAGYKNELTIAEWLLAAGANTQKQGKDGLTPGAVARQYGHIQLADIIDEF